MLVVVRGDLDDFGALDIPSATSLETLIFNDVGADSRWARISEKVLASPLVQRVPVIDFSNMFDLWGVGALLDAAPKLLKARQVRFSDASFSDDDRRRIEQLFGGRLR
jgi:hypothetical protein